MNAPVWIGGSVRAREWATVACPSWCTTDHAAEAAEQDANDVEMAAGLTRLGKPTTPADVWDSTNHPSVHTGVVRQVAVRGGNFDIPGYTDVIVQRYDFDGVPDPVGVYVENPRDWIEFYSAPEARALAAALVRAAEIVEGQS